MSGESSYAESPTALRANRSPLGAMPCLHPTRLPTIYQMDRPASRGPSSPFRSSDSLSRKLGWTATVL